MKKLGLFLTLLLAMAMGSHRVFAQSVTVVLMPGWNWISVPLIDTLDFETAMGSVTPAVGDIIKSRWGAATYTSDGQWRGTISQFYPGYGYHYKSNRTMPVMLTFNAQQPAPQVVVTTSEPTDITTTSTVVGGTVTIGEGNHIFARGVCWGTESNPTIDGSYQAGDNVAGSQSFTLINLTPSTTYYVRAYVVTDYGLSYGGEQSFTTHDGGSSGDHEYVDLGLPSGTLWATCNVGANAPEEYGDYFAWGETQTKSIFDWDNYQYCHYINFNTYPLTKYCTISSYGYNGFTDDLTILLPEDDAATANWGVAWRMPTKTDWQELYNNTTNTWTTQNGVYGRLFVGPNGNNIFLPATNYQQGSNRFNSYWSSSLNSDYNPLYAYDIHFNSDSFLMTNSIRKVGKSIRPVRSAE